MPSPPFRYICMLALLLVAPARGEPWEALTVRAEARPGPYLVGQAIELVVGVAARGQRPTLELPTVKNADLWIIATDFRPRIATGIGDMVASENLFLTRLRIVPRRQGPLEIPPFTARLDDRSGRSRSLRLTIEGVPLEGRLATFLGGVGDFSVQAEAMPRSVRVGQELTYRIRVEGPAALGMTDRPSLERLERLGIKPRVEPSGEEPEREPPARTFSYRLRPGRAGDFVLPPVSISAFDPKPGRYITRVSPGIPIKVVEVLPFDPATLDYGGPGSEEASTSGMRRAIAAGLIAAVCLSALAFMLGRRWSRHRPDGPAAARRLARRTLRELNQLDKTRTADTNLHVSNSIAQLIMGRLIDYARVGAGRPPGAMTPREAREAIARITGDDSLGDRAAEVVGRCDLALFAPRTEGSEVLELIGDAQRLFEFLGSVAISGSAGPEGSA